MRRAYLPEDVVEEGVVRVVVHGEDGLLASGDGAGRDVRRRRGGGAEGASLGGPPL